MVGLPTSQIEVQPRPGKRPPSERMGVLEGGGLVRYYSALFGPEAAFWNLWVLGGVECDSLGGKVIHDKPSSLEVLDNSIQVKSQGVSWGYFLCGPSKSNYTICGAEGGGSGPRAKRWYLGFGK